MSRPKPPRLRGRHKIAIANHCRLACETVHPRFRAFDGQLSSILTVNTGYE
jgi:hypothetical protein